MSRSSSLLSVVVLALPAVASAQTYGTDGVTCGFPTLAAAIATGDPIVWVSPGTHALAATVVIAGDVALVGADQSCTAGSVGRPEVVMAGAGRLFEVNGGVTLELESIEVGGGSTTGSGGTILLNAGSDLLMRDAEVSDGHAGVDGGCVYATNNSLVDLNDGSVIADCDADQNGGNVALGFDATLNVDWSSSITGGWADGNGGNVLVEGTATALIDGSVLGGHAEMNGGGLALAYGDGDAPELLSTALIDDNVALLDGGGVWVDSLAENAWITLLLGTQVTNNTARNGGGFYLGDGTLESLASTSGSALVAWNTALASGSGEGGGGLFVMDAAVIGRSLEVHANDAHTAVGGGLHALRSTIDLDNSWFVSNEAGKAGGLIVREGSLTLGADFDRCTPTFVAGEWQYCSRVDQNVSMGTVGTGRGGGIAVSEGSTALIEETGFRGNYSEIEGNALVLSGSASAAEVRNCLFDDNQHWNALNTAVLALGGDLQVYSSTFQDNVTPLAWTAGTTGVMTRTVFDDNTNDVVLVAGITGNCNLAQTNAGLPTGTNNTFGDAALDAYGHPDASSTSVVDQCSAGPVIDILGNVRPVPSGSWDRGAVELQ